MLDDVPLLRVMFCPSAEPEPLALLCEVLNINGQELVWVDGVNQHSPVLVEKGALAHIQPAGTFKDHLIACAGLRPGMDLQGLLSVAEQEKLSTTAVARVVEVMAEQGLSVPDALDCVVQWGQLIVMMDSHNRLAFDVAVSSVGSASPWPSNAALGV